MLEEHPEIGNMICQFISQSSEIQEILKKWNKGKSEDDQDSVILLEQKNVIAKGTTKKMVEIAKKAKVPVKTLFEEVHPICFVKIRGEK